MRGAMRAWLALMLGALALISPTTAEAGNVPHPKLDEIASEIAGPGKTVWCEADEGEWRAMPAWQSGSLGFVRFWSYDGGQTWAPESVAYVAPLVCHTLHAALNRGYEAAPTRTLALSLLVLLHESVHLGGVKDEAETDCEALRRVEDVAVRHFAVPRTVSLTDTLHRYETVYRYRTVLRWRTVYRWKVVNGRRVRVQARVRVRVRVRVPVRVEVVEHVTREVANAELAALVEFAHDAHRSAPPQYQGKC